MTIVQWHERWDPWALALLALVGRAWYLVSHGAGVLEDSLLYARAANNLLTHGTISVATAAPFDPTIALPPVFPVFLAAVTSVFGTAEINVAVIQVLLGSSVVFPVVSLARRIMPRPWAFVAGLAFVAHPGAIWMTSQLLTEGLFTVFAAWGLWLAARGFEGRHRVVIFIAGAILGIAMLTRSVGMLLPPFLATIMVLFGRDSFTVRLRGALWLVLGAAVVVAPWAARCSSLAGSFVPIQANGAVNVYVPTRYDLDQRDYIVSWWAAIADLDAVRAQATTPAGMVAGDRAGMAMAVANIKRDPLAYLRSRARTVPYLFLTSFDMVTGINRPFFELSGARDIPVGLVKWSLFLGFSVLPFGLAFVSLALARHSPAALLCAGAWGYVLLIHVPLWIEYRFWLPAVPFQMISAVAGAWWVWQRVRRHSPNAGGPANTHLPNTTGGMSAKDVQ